MRARLEQAPEAIFIAAAEKAERLNLGGVGCVLSLQRVHVEAEIVADHMWADEATFMEEAHRLRRRIYVVDVTRLIVVGT